MKRFLTLGVLGAGLLAVMPAVSLADTQGHEMVVAQAGAPVMRGRSTLATLPAGHRFQIIRREGRWVGTRTTINGRTVSGWLWQGNVTTPQQFAQRSAARRYSYQPGTPIQRYSYAPAVGGTDRPLVMGATEYGPRYWRADRKITGY
jgi:hypothetical protein